MIFEYDDAKSRSNLVKHGIDFKDAQGLWDDPYAIELRSNNSIDEERFLVIGKIMSRHYTAIITYREDKVRIISVRRSRQKEEALYESLRTG